MFLKRYILSLVLLFSLLFTFIPNSFSGTIPTETDNSGWVLYSFFDLRERESYVQVTNVDSDNAIVHIQVFDVSNNCNENNFFDVYTPNDTHIYNLRNITTNDSNPSGVALPDGAYGFVTALVVISPGGSSDTSGLLIGNYRVLDNNGYEYRTNSIFPSPPTGPFFTSSPFTFNYNSNNGVTLSDVIGFVFDRNNSTGEILASNITETWAVYDVDIVNNSEVIFSCRNVIFACTDKDNPLLEELLQVVGNASVASFEYGINETISHSKGGELLCPGNIINEGVVILNNITFAGSSPPFGIVGLNNGNGRGSMDSWIAPVDGFSI